MILILGPTGSGKTIVAHAIKSCFKNCILSDGPKDQKEDFRRLFDDYDCVIVTCQTRHTDNIGFGCSLRLAYSVDYIFRLEKIESGVVKVECMKNRHRRHGDKFYLAALAS